MSGPAGAALAAATTTSNGRVNNAEISDEKNSISETMTVGDQYERLSKSLNKLYLDIFSEKYVWIFRNEVLPENKVNG